METQDRSILNSAIYGGTPLKSYIKTILGKVYVTVLDQLEGIPEGVILEGDPRQNQESCIVDVWSEEEDYYFRKKNKRHLETGTIIPYTRKDVGRERTIEEFSDEELEKIVRGKFFTLQAALNTTNSVATLYRMKNIAQAAERSDSIIKAIEARLSEVQAQEYKPLPPVIDKEL